MLRKFSHYENPSRFLLVVILGLAVITSNGVAGLAVNLEVLAAGDTSIPSPKTGLHPSTAGNVRRVDPKKSGGAGAGSPRIVFGTVRNSGNHDIFLMDLDGSNQTRITNDAAYDDQPKWSPDGSRIAFMSNRDGNFEIYTMNADDSAQTRVTNNLAADGFPA